MPRLYSSPAVCSRLVKISLATSHAAFGPRLPSSSAQSTSQVPSHLTYTTHAAILSTVTSLPAPIMRKTTSSFSSHVDAASSATARSRHAPSGSSCTELLSLGGVAYASLYDVCFDDEYVSTWGVAVAAYD